MVEMDEEDAEHHTYGKRNECDTPHCAAGWVAANFGCSLRSVLRPVPGTPLAAFVGTLKEEMLVEPGFTVEDRFEGWDGGRKMSAFSFACAWNRAIRRHGYTITFSRPKRFR
jgi:hypothetical protein